MIGGLFLESEYPKLLNKEDEDMTAPARYSAGWFEAVTGQHVETELLSCTNQSVKVT